MVVKPPQGTPAPAASPPRPSPETTARARPTAARSGSRAGVPATLLATVLATVSAIVLPGLLVSPGGPFPGVAPPARAEEVEPGTTTTAPPTTAAPTTTVAPTTAAPTSAAPTSAAPAPNTIPTGPSSTTSPGPSGTTVASSSTTLPGGVVTSTPVPVLLDGPGTTLVPSGPVELPADLLPVGPFAEPPPPFSLAPTTLPAIPADPSGRNLSEDPSEAPPPRRGVPDSPYTAPYNPYSYQQVLAALTSEQRAKVLAAQARADEAAARVTAAQQALDILNDQRDRVLTDVARLDTLRGATVEQMRRRALRLYAGEQTQMLAVLLDAQSAASLGRRTDFVSQAQQSDAELVRRYRSSRAELQEKDDDLETIARKRRDELTRLQQEQATVDEELRLVRESLAQIESRGALSFGGMFFPVQLPVSYVDTYGAPRMQGTQYYHWHQGTDIFAPMGTPIRAVQRGVVSVVGERPLGGLRMWLEAADGTQYYYAHLAAYAPGIEAGSVVEGGQILGYVGDTGNAKGTPAHLHFEVHPDVTGPVNPYPILKAIQNADAEEFLRATQPSLPPVSAAPLLPTTTTLPTPGSTTRPAPGVGTPSTVGAPTTTRPLPTLPVPSRPATTGPTAAATSTTRPATTSTTRPATTSTTRPATTSTTRP